MSAPDAAWHDNFDALQSFIMTHGSMPLHSSLDDAERRLYGWVKRQRVKARAGKLPAENRRCLDDFDPAILGALRPQRVSEAGGTRRSTLTSKAWDLNASKVRTYVETFAKLPARRNEDRSVASLGTWIGEQRRAHSLGNLDAEAVSVLDGIHPHILASKEARRPGFAKRLDELERFIAKHDRLPQANNPKEAELSGWMRYHQRESVGQKSDRIAAVRARYGLNARQIFRTWDESFELTQTHLAELGELPTRARDERLGNWLSRCQQRHQAGSLTDDQIIKLRELGVDFTMNGVRGLESPGFSRGEG